MFKSAVNQNSNGFKLHKILNHFKNWFLFHFDGFFVCDRTVLLEGVFFINDFTIMDIYDCCKKIRISYIRILKKVFY